MWYDYDRGYRPYGGARSRVYGAAPYGRDYGRGGYGWGGYDTTYRRAPSQSPTYGRAGDEAARRFARSHGYDTGYTIQPDQTSGFRAWRGSVGPRYDRGFRGYDRGFWGTSRYGAYPDSGWGHPW